MKVMTQPAALDAQSHPTTALHLSAQRLAQLRQLLVSGAAIGVCIVGWYVLAHFKLNLGIVSFVNVPAPLEVLQSFVRFSTLPDALSHLKASVLRVQAGFFAAAIAGIALGVVIGRSALCRQLLMPPLEVLRPIPAVAWIPLAVLMFPSSEISMIFITFLGALFPILLNTIHGVEDVDPRLIASARSLGSQRWSIFKEVVLPAATPNIVTGLAIGMGTCWFCLISAEMISGQLGIGYFTWESFTLQNYADIIVGMLLIGALGLFSSALIRWIGRQLTPWHHTGRKAS